MQAAWSTRRTRWRLGVICLVSQLAIGCCGAGLAYSGIFGGASWQAATVLTVIQLALIALFWIPAVRFFWEYRNPALCFDVAQRCESCSNVGARSVAIVSN